MPISTPVPSQAAARRPGLEAACGTREAPAARGSTETATIDWRWNPSPPALDRLRRPTRVVPYCACEEVTAAVNR